MCVDVGVGVGVGVGVCGDGWVDVRVCGCACVRACVRVRVRECVRACVGRARGLIAPASFCACLLDMLEDHPAVQAVDEYMCTGGYMCVCVCVCVCVYVCVCVCAGGAVSGAEAAG